MSEKEKDFGINGTDTKSTDEKNANIEVLTSNEIISQSEEKVNALENDFITFDTRTPKELEFVWYPLIVKGNLNIIVGVGGTGKSFLTCWLLSAITNGD